MMLAACLFAAALSFAKPTVVPVPEKLSYKDDVEVRLDAAQTVRVCCPDAAAVGWVRDHMRQWFVAEPKVVAETVAIETAEEGYRLKAEPSGITLEAKTLQGIRYAMYTLRQVAERDSSGYKVAYYRLPELEVEDSPRLKFRGLHLCWFPEQSGGLKVPGTTGRVRVVWLAEWALRAVAIDGAEGEVKS